MDNQNNQLTTKTSRVILPDTLEVKKNIGHDKLLACLYFLLDSFERAQMDFFLVKQTARSARSKNQLEGEGITIGVRKLEWASDTKDILFAYFENERVENGLQLPDKLEFSWNEVPFTIYLYDDSEPLTALNFITYEYESWHIPNQFERFEKEYDHD